MIRLASWTSNPAVSIGGWISNPAARSVVDENWESSTIGFYLIKRPFPDQSISKKENPSNKRQHRLLFTTRRPFKHPSSKMSANHIKVVFGTAGALFTEATAPEIYRELLKNGVTTLDTAQLYEGKEEVIGNTSGGDSFVIDSKEMGGFNPKTATKQTVLQRGKESMEKLKAKQVSMAGE